MRLHTEWLKELVPVEVSPRDLAKTLTRLGLETERLIELRTALEGVVMGEILTIEPHPEAAGMYVCQIDLGGSSSRQIVCGSEHPLEAGWRVPVALPGMTLPTGVVIKESKFRGQLSQGMVSLDRELGVLPQGTGLAVGHEDVSPGLRLIDFYDTPGALLEVNPLPNRPDWMGLVGIARELAAFYGVALRRPGTGEGQESRLPVDGGEGISVEILDPLGCPRYTAQVVRGIKVGKSPMWLSSRLVIAGLRSINNVVDITNLVLFEYGQPLHAFDLNRLGGGRIRVRSAQRGETLLLLDESQIELDEEVLVIADAEQPVALAGIMGGADSGVSSTTQDVVLESAYFDRVSIRSTARRYGLRTEASIRFERGVDPNDGVTEALGRATRLVVEVAGGAASGPSIDIYPAKIAPRRLDLTPSQVNAVLGLSLSAEQIDSRLLRLGMRRDNGAVIVPTWRTDAIEPAVLVEDVARHEGYDTVPMNPPEEATLVRPVPLLPKMRWATLDHLVQQGLWEVSTFSLDNPQRLRGFAEESQPELLLKNPANQDLSALRYSMLPRLLDVMQYNARRHREPLRFFEVEKLFRPGEERPEGVWHVAGIVSGPALDSYWAAPTPRMDFFWVKGLIESLLDVLGLGSESRGFTQFERSFLEPGQASTLLVGGAEAGWLGRLAPSVLEEWDLPPEVYAFDLDLEVLAGILHNVPKRYYRSVPRFPSMIRDLSLVVEASAADLERSIRETGGTLIESVHCYDAFQMEGDARSLTFAIRYRSQERTLTSEEINDLEAEIIARLEKDHAARLRGGQN